MNRRALPGLVAVAVALLGTLWLVRLQDAPPAGLGAPLLAPLGESAARLSVVRITLPGDRVLLTLEQRGNDWVAAEYGDWPADTGRLRALALALAEARRVEQLGAGPEAWHRLGLQDIGEPEADGVAVTLEYNGARDTLIIGRTGVVDGEHSYVRRVGEPSAWTVNRNLAVARSAADWLRRELTDLPPGRIRQVSTSHADGERLTVTRAPGSGARFEVQDLPDGAELLHETVADEVGAVLDRLGFDALHEAAGRRPEEVTRTDVLTDDGLRVTVHAWREGDRRLAELAAGVDPDRVEAHLRQTPAEDADAVTDDGPPAPPDADAPVAPERLERAVDERQGEADALNRRFAGWRFELPEHRHARLTRRLQDLLAD